MQVPRDLQQSFHDGSRETNKVGPDQIPKLARRMNCSTRGRLIGVVQGSCMHATFGCVKTTVRKRWSSTRFATEAQAQIACVLQKKNLRGDVHGKGGDRSVLPRKHSCKSRATCQTKTYTEKELLDYGSADGYCSWVCLHACMQRLVVSKHPCVFAYNIVQPS